MNFNDYIIVIIYRYLFILKLKLMITESNIYISLMLATLLLAFSVRLGISLYKSN